MTLSVTYRRYTVNVKIRDNGGTSCSFQTKNGSTSVCLQSSTDRDPIPIFLDCRLVDKGPTKRYETH